MMTGAMIGMMVLVCQEIATLWISSSLWVANVSKGIHESPKWQHQGEVSSQT